MVSLADIADIKLTLKRHFDLAYYADRLLDLNLLVRKHEGRPLLRFFLLCHTINLEITLENERKKEDLVLLYSLHSRRGLLSAGHRRF